MEASLVAVIVGSLLVAVDCEQIGENLALRGRPTQSSVLAGQWENVAHLALAMNAVDGNQDPEYSHGSCSHTHDDYGPWWRVDLITPYKINSIVITARNSSPERLNGAEILIGNSLANHGNNNPRCAYISGIGKGATQTYQCHNMVGRYVNIIVPGRKEFLTLCEVQIFGEPTYDYMG